MDQLNAEMRARLYPDRDPTGEWSETWEDDGTDQELRIGIGDLIRTRKNWSQGRTNWGRAVVNGATWTVEAITAAGIWVNSPNRGRILLDTGYLTDRRPTIEHGWASTIIGAGTGSDAFYIGVTRGRHTNLIPAPAPSTK